eukprot:jgi/Phyca11/109030/e_gw1.16.2.1
MQFQSNQDREHVEALLTSLVQRLDVQDSNTRKTRVSELYAAVTSLSRQLSAERFAKALGQLTPQLYNLLQKGSSESAQLGALLAIESLIDVSNEDQFIRFVNYLRYFLQQPQTSTRSLLAASSAMGKLAASSVSGTLVASFVDFEAKRAFEWLQDGQPGTHAARNEALVSQRRLAACFVLRELAQAAPTLFHVNLTTFFQSIWGAVRDQRVEIREAATSALAACLQLITRRQTRHRVQWYCKVYDQVFEGLKLRSSGSSTTTGQTLASWECAHGSLLVIGELIANTGRFMVPRFREVCDTVLRYKDAKERLVSRAVSRLLPQLAEFCPGAFVQYYLDVCVGHLTKRILEYSAPASERGVAFLAMGRLSLAVGDALVPHVPPILKLVKESLAPHTGSKRKRTRNKLFCVQTLTCVANMSRALGPKFEPFFGSLMIKGETGDEIDTILLSLRTLSCFDFSGSFCLLPFVRDCVALYLKNPDARIRKQAVITCSKLLLPSPESPDTALMSSWRHVKKRGPSGRVIDLVLTQLLQVGISDMDVAVRTGVVESLDARFDELLSQEAHLKLVFLFLNDENAYIRERAMQLLERLAPRNPAFVMPSLRRVIIQLVTELQHTSDLRMREDSTRLLGHLIRGAQHLIDPYVVRILEVLLPILVRGNAPLTMAVLVTLGELALVSRTQIAAYERYLFPLIIHTLQDHSSIEKRQVALQTLGQLAGSTGCVVRPYLASPKLLEIFLSLLHHNVGSPWSLRREAMRTIGILGALDPYKYKLCISRASLRQANEVASLMDSELELDPTELSPASEAYFPTVAIHALLRILREPSLNAHHHGVIQAIMFIFKSLSTQCVPFLKYILPPFLRVLSRGEPRLRESLFLQLTTLISIVNAHMKPFFQPIMVLALRFWGSHLPQIVRLVEKISQAAPHEFRTQYFPKLLPKLLEVLQPQFGLSAIQVQVVQSLIVFGDAVEDYVYLLVPALVHLMESLDTPLEVKITTVYTLARICVVANFEQYAGPRLLQPLARVASQSEATRFSEVMLYALGALVFQLQAEVLSFEPLLQQIIASLPFSHRGTLSTSLRRGVRVPRAFLDDPAFLTSTLRKFSTELQATTSTTPAPSPPTNVRLHVNQQNLRRAWEASQRSTKEDWLEWMRRFSIELLRESPSAALRSCCALAQAYNPLARALFNPAFVSCWNELYEQYQDYLVRALETAFQSDTIPAEILQTLLNLAEFMEHDVEALPIDIRELGELAQKCHAYAKALHYKELEFHTSPSTCIEALISINNQLGQPEAAVGILKYAQAHHSRVIQVKETWFEKLQDWRAALALYDRRLQQEDQGLDIEVCIGKMRCLEALGKWEELGALAAQVWAALHSPERTTALRRVAMLGARASWCLSQWDSMTQYVTESDEDVTELSLYQSVLAVHRNNFEQATTLIDDTRKTLDTKLGALVGESYSRAYRSMVTLQQLSELEEVVTYKKLRAQISKGEEAARYKRHLMRMWHDRLSGCKRVVEVWQQLIAVRALILTPHEDIDTYLQFASLCRQSGNLSLSLKMLSVAPSSGSPSFGFGEKDRHRVAFAYLKHLWAAGQKQEALSDLHRLVVRISEQEELLVKCHLKLAEWQLAVHDQQIEHVPVESVLSSLRLCTELEPRSYKAWHAWALMNFQVVEHSTHSQHISANATASVAASSSVAPYIAPAIEGFFRSIALGRSRWAANVQQDILRVLTLWFAHGHRTDVHAALEKGFRSVSIETWLIVIPQLIARIHTPYPRIQKQLHRLLVVIGKQHPHALIYPLSVALKSSVSERQQAADAIMSTMRTNYVELVDEALLVSRELIRVAILWHEMWHEGLEEASRLYFGENNVDGMAEVLRPLHAMMERGPETLREVSFHGAFGRDLREANEWFQRFLSNRRNESDLNRAWDLYYHVFRRINKQLPQITTLELQVVSPNLLSARNLQLAVPGTYRAGHAIVKIGSFLPTVAVITSKQRPRRITIVGSNGLEYMFLLKGHEDLRQDERVTQLFGLVNALLINDRNTSKKDLKIHRYPVIPLSDNAGIVGWVPHCDTLHQLIRDYREARKILLNIEHRLMLQMAPDYDALTLLEKVEVFQYALENTAGQDLYKVLWLKSENSEVWLDRRTNYTRSLAVMSMVGYILGLGDRHPSNLMLHRFTGTIVHIDFGDCFEVAMDREKYPEKIPFRLTRMLTNAMEVSGIEGNFRFSCESVMAVLRENRHSLMAMLEAFVHDPLINWRLLSATNVQPSGSSVASSIPPSTDVVPPSAANSDLHANRSVRERELLNALGPEGIAAPRIALNEKAVAVIRRVQAKLSGRDFEGDGEPLDVSAQVQRLISQATSHENLCQCYIGWCPFW